MILPTAEAIEARKRGYQRRTPYAVLVFVLIVVAALTPHVLVTAATPYYGRNLFMVSRFFLMATPGGPAFAGGTSPGAIGFGLSVTYLGLALQQLGSLLGVGTFWVLIAEDVGRWVRRFAMLAGGLLILGAATTVIGYRELLVAQVPTLPGIAWLFTGIAGVCLLVGAYRTKERLTSSWFWAKPELDQP